VSKLPEKVSANRPAAAPRSRGEDMEADLEAKVRWARSEDAAAFAIAKRGQQFARTVATFEWAWWHQAAVLRAVAARQGFAPSPSETSGEFCCEDVQGARQPKQFESFNFTEMCRLPPCRRAPGAREALPPNTFS